ncbi:hypothetical protein B0T42_09185 [Rathayibacter sp. VKM Ac-2630]|nr:hypothetical protein B0T42_09185 [Rathayibacter sp. VKM Ac-2630]
MSSTRSGSVPLGTKSAVGAGAGVGVVVGRGVAVGVVVGVAVGVAVGVGEGLGSVDEASLPSSKASMIRFASVAAGFFSPV